MHRIARTLVFLSTLFVLTTAAENAYADSFSVSWSGVYGLGSGIFTATDEGSGAFLITSISGTQNGMSVSLLNPFSYGGNDNKLYPAGPTLLDTSGFAFAVGADDFNIYSDISAGTYWECLSTATNCASVGDGFQLESFSVTPNASVPEPSSTILLSVSSGLMVFIGFVRRKSLHRLAG